MKVIIEIQVGLGPCGELRYLSYPAKHGWDLISWNRAISCFDKYLIHSSTKWVESKGRNDWANALKESAITTPALKTLDFFVMVESLMYSKNLLDHGDKVLLAARDVFGADMHIPAKVAGIHFILPPMPPSSLRDTIITTHKGFKSTYPDAMCDPEDLAWQVLNTGWKPNIP
ncbi:hypothetical protein ACFE04_018040 [Oxalis oulophora]